MRPDIPTGKRTYRLAAVTLLLMALRFASGFMHSEGEHLHYGSEVSSSVCAACEIEATTLSDSSSPVELPVAIQSDFVHFETPTLERPILRPIIPFDLRGPPTEHS